MTDILGGTLPRTTEAAPIKDELMAAGSAVSSAGGWWGWCNGRAVAPLLLRLVVGVTFIWAGLGKMLGTMSVPPERAAMLANMGAIDPLRLERGDSAPGDEEGAGGPDGLAPKSTLPPPPRSPTPLAQVREAAGRAGQATRAQRVFSPEDFEGQVEVKRLWGVALRVHGAANPPVGRFGEQPPTLWPRTLGSAAWARRSAYAVTGAEILCGVLLLAGLLTRPAALVLMFTMLGALWLDQLAPAIQSGATVLAVLPAYPRFSDEWSKPLWQALLAAACGSLAMLGGGLLSIDRGIGAYRASAMDDDAL